MYCTYSLFSFSVVRLLWRQSTWYFAHRKVYQEFFAYDINLRCFFLALREGFRYMIPTRTEPSWVILYFPFSLWNRLLETLPDQNHILLFLWSPLTASHASLISLYLWYSHGNSEKLSLVLGFPTVINFQWTLFNLQDLVGWSSLHWRNRE